VDAFTPRPAIPRADGKSLAAGESGMGKTMLIRKFERRNAVGFDDAAGIQCRPVVRDANAATTGQHFIVAGANKFDGKTKRRAPMRTDGGPRQSG
jgi:hypothetical protein